MHASVVEDVKHQLMSHSQTPRFSVVIPTYNCGHLLPRAIASVKAQTLGGWEIVVVDDGSDDDTPGIVSQLGEPNVRVLHRRRSGGASTRNAGVAASRGEYIFMLDADDEWRPTFLEKHVSAMEKEKTLWSFCDVERIENGQSRIILSELRGADPLEGAFLQRFYPMYFKGFHREIFRRVGMYDETLPTLEDVDLCARFLLAGMQFSYIREPLYIYHIQPKSLTKPNGASGRVSNTRVLEQLYRKYYPGQVKTNANIRAEYARMMWELSRYYAVNRTGLWDVARTLGTAVATSPSWCASEIMRITRRRRAAGGGPQD